MLSYYFVQFLTSGPFEKTGTMRLVSDHWPEGNLSLTHGEKVNRYGLKGLFATMFVVFMAASCVQAQRVGVSVGINGVRITGFGDVDIEKTVGFWREEYRTMATEEFDLFIEQLVHVCELSEPETKKLQIAVKGVIAKRIRSGEEQIEYFSKTSGLLEPDEELAEPEISENDKLNFYGGGPLPEGVVKFKYYFSTPISKHPLWIKTIEKTLGAEKLATYEQFNISRNRKMLEASAAKFVAYIDGQLFLSNEQAEAIAQHIVSEFEDQITLNKPRTVLAAEKMIADKFGKSYDSLGDLLTKKQTGRRERLMQSFPGAAVGWGSGPDR